MDPTTTSTRFRAEFSVLEQLQHRTEELVQEKRLQEAICAITEAMNTSGGLRPFLTLVHHHVAELMEAQNFYVALFDPDSRLYSFPYFTDDIEGGRILEPENLDHSLTDYVRRKGPLLADATVHQWLIAQGEVQGVIGPDSAVWLGVPLRLSGQPEAIGVMVVQSYHDSRSLGEREKRILTTLSATVTLAIDRIRLAADAVHHFDNSVTAIRGNAEILLLENRRQQKRLEATLKGLLPPSPELAEFAQQLLADFARQNHRLEKILEISQASSERIHSVFTPPAAEVP